MRFVPSDAERSRVVAAPVPPNSNEAARQVFDILNRKRVAMGLSELEWSDRLAELARLHSDDMATHDLFSHRGSDGSMVDERADRLHLGGWAGIGENIAFLQNFADPAGTAIDKWLESPSHRGNMLSTQWKETGVGVAVTKDGKYFFTQVFLLRK
jgi:uncharacterized protein YkwD